MKQLDYIEKLFQKFVTNSLTKKEFTFLMDFIKNSSNKVFLENMIDKYWSSLQLQEFDKERTSEKSKLLFQNIITKINKEPSLKKTSSRRKLYKVAAVFVTLLGLAYIFQILKNPTNKANPIDPNAITLRLSDGTIKIISDNDNEEKTIADKSGKIIGSQKGNQLHYNSGDIPEDLVYNELYVPYGKQLDLVLSDGSTIKLNSGTTVKYPIQFIEGKDRVVYLNGGEAFFDIAKDKLRPFIVNADPVNVQVHGTKFNMSFYPEDANINTVLVEGSVSLNEVNNKYSPPHTLSPGYIATWDKARKKMSVKEADISLHTAWINGNLLFKNTPFNTIRKKLERHFDVIIKDDYNSLENQVYTATFRNETIQEILEAFREDTPFIYTINGNKINITPVVTTQTKNSSQ